MILVCAFFLQHAEVCHLHLHFLKFMNVVNNNNGLKALKNSSGGKT